MEEESNFPSFCYSFFDTRNTWKSSFPTLYSSYYTKFHQKKRALTLNFLKFGLTLSMEKSQPFLVFLDIDPFDNRHTKHIEDDNSKQ